ncbi:MAG: hypothetical protein HC898_02270 [Phycisphaerales bacterium]|nr:hypothetical protein [Phycisphaerales bacterium]
MGRLRRRGKQPAPTRLSVHESMEKQRQMRALNTDMEQVMVEIQQMARQVSAQLDAKAAHLEQLIKEADQRLKRLEEMQTGGIAKQSSPQGHGSDDMPAEDSDNAMSNADAGTKHGLSNALNANRADDPDPLALQVYLLADRGLAPAAIAGELHEHVGKVELILALRQT